jgi:hypothetical protein
MAIKKTVNNKLKLGGIKSKPSVNGLQITRVEKIVLLGRQVL